MKAVSGGSNTAILIAVLVVVLITLSLVVVIWMRLGESPGSSVSTVAVTQTTTPVSATTTPAMVVETENLQIVAAYVERISGGWNIYLTVKNVGTTDATIDNVFINGRPWSSYSGASINPPLPIPVKADSRADITITIPGNTGFVSEQVVEVKLHTARGKEYPMQVTLP